MAKEAKVGQLVIDLKIKTEALEKGLETAKKKLQNLEEQNKQVQSSNKQLDASFIAMSASIVVSLMKIKSAVDSGIEKYKEYESANKGLESIVKGQGLSFSNAQSFIEEYIADGLIPLSDATLAYKNLASRGYNEEQIKQTMIALKDAAAFGRQSTYEYGQAIATATEGLKNENSILVDNAGVTKNVAKMWQDYARSIGKTTESLTQAEKIEAEVNGIREESKNQIGDAAKYAETYAGQQAQVNAVNIELSKSIGESMIPALTQYKTIQLSITKSLVEFISKHKSSTSGVITFTTTLLAAVVALTAMRKAYTSYKAAAEAANLTTKAFTASLLANPITLIALGISAAVTGLTVFNTKMQETIDKMDKVTEKSKTLVEAIKNTQNNDMVMSESDKTTIENAKKDAEEIVKTYEEKKKKIESIENQIKDIQQSNKLSFQKNGEIDALNVQLKQANKELKKYEKETFLGGESIDFYTKKVDTLSKYLMVNNEKQEYARLTNQKVHRETLINIAQTKADIQGKQQLLDILKKGKSTTEEYTDAKNKLVKIYPELAKVNENTIASTQAAINAENSLADIEWVNAQIAIQASIAEVSAMLSNSEKIQLIANITKQSVEEVTASLQNQIEVLGNLAKLSPEDFKGSVTSSYKPKTSTSSSYSNLYSNKALDNYKKQIEHKKALDQLSTQQEIAMYEYALKKYAKTADEKNEIREKIYELNKELAQKERELLTQQTEDYETYIQNQKNLRGSAYDITEETKDYNKIIQMHKNYLNQIMKDERLSLDERKSIYREELQTIREYEQKKRDLRVEQIDNTATHLTNAITKQLEEMQKKDKDFIDKQIEQVEKLKEIRINAINSEYDAKIEAIEKELAALDKAEQEKSRQEEDAEYEQKRKRLQDLIDFEHDTVTKANYQKELNKLIEEYQKTLNNRALEDRKEALNEQKDLLQEEQDSKTKAIEEETEAQKEVYNKQIEELEDYYSKQVDMAQETAEKMLLNVQENQDNILSLLKNYGNAYEITGQSLGEKLAQGINEGVASKIENIIQRVQDTINAGIENKLAQLSSSVYRYEAGSDKPQTKTINVTQQNYIQQNPELPSETYRKLRNIDEELAASLAGV